MKRFNRVLSLLVCFAMVAVSMPAISLVSADLTYMETITITDDMGYASFADATNWSWTALESGGPYTQAGVDSSGNITYTQILEKQYKSSTSTTNNGNWAEALKYNFPKVTIGEDSNNKTRITTNNYKGKVDIALTYDINIIDQQGSNPFFYITVNGNDSIMQNRTYNTYSTVYSPASKVGSIGSSASRTEYFTINTDDLSVTAESDNKSYNFTSSGNAKYVSNVSITSMQRCDLGTSFVVKGAEVKFTPSLSDAEKAKFESLDAKLVDDVSNVTENIALPAIDGVTWSSSDENVISRTGVVTKKVGETQNVTLIATFAVDGVTYNKEYDMVVAAGTEVTPDPDPGDNPESGVVVLPDGTVQIKELMGYSSFAEAQANGWTYTASDYTSIGVDTDGNIVHTQTTQGAAATLDGKLTYNFPEITVLEDTVNKTVLKTNNYRGEAKVDVSYYASVPDNNAWYDIRIGGVSKYAIALENRNTYYTAKNSSYSGLKNVDNSGKNSLFVGKDRNAALTINTATGDVSATDTSTDRVLSGKSDFDFVSQITLQSQQKLATDSYCTIKGIAINLVPQELSADEIAEINTIVPETLASSDGKVYENLNLSAYANVTWKSSDTSVITDAGVVKRVKDQEKTVELTATFKTSAGLTFAKTYTLTVAAGNNTVKFYSDGQEYDQQDVATGEKATKPADPVKDGYTFVGWCTDEQLTNEFNFETAITDNLDLYAKFEVNTVPGPGTDPDDKPESGIVVSPDGTVQIKELMGYSSFEEAQANGWSYVDSDYSEVSVDAEGRIVHKQTGTSTDTNFAALLTYKFPELTVLEDTVNKTVVKTNNYRGDAKVSIAYYVDLPNRDYYYDMRIGGDAKHAIYTQVKSDYFTAKDSNGSTLKDVTTGSSANIFAGKSRNTIYTINTVTDAVTAIDEGATGSSIGRVVAGTSDVKFISQLTLQAQQSIATGSSLIFKGITIDLGSQELSADEIAEINTIVPETLASADGKVYENLDLSAYKNVTWKSSDTSVITDAGVVKRVKGQEKTVELTATFKTSGGITFSKTYTLTVAAGNNTVKFWSEGQEYDYQDVVTGEKATKPADPVKDGYTFVGWYTDEQLTNEFNFETAITDNLNLYAKFKVNTYKVYFRVNSFVQDNLTMEVVNNTAIGTVPEVPAQAGKTPIGWVIQNSGNAFLKEDTIITADMYVDAVYSEAGATPYKVTFMNGDQVHAEVSAWAGYTIEFPETIPLKDNYTFVRWERGGVEFKETDLMIAKDITVDAVFTPNPVEIKFYSDENTLYRTETGYYDTAFGQLPPSPTVAGKAFNGWKTADGTSFSAETIVTGPVSLYAVWGVPNVIVDEDITKYTSTTDGLIQFKIPENSTITASFDNGLKLYQSAWEPLNTSGAKNGTFNSAFVGYLRSLVSSDDASRTKVYMNSLVGEYEVELGFDAKFIDMGEYNGVSLSGSFWQMYTGGNNPATSTSATAPYTVRLMNFEGGSMSSTIYGGDSYSKSRPFGSSFKLDHTYTVHFNTYTGVATAWNDNTANDPQGGTWSTYTNSINTFSLSNILRTGIGSYYTLKNVKVTEYYTDKDSVGYKQSMGLIETLPATLGDENPYAITKDIELPQTEGIVWTTSDESIITADGKVTSWYDDADVTLTATATSEDGAYVYSKEYVLTVKGYIPEKQNIAIDMNVEKWSFDNRADIQEAKHSVESDGSLKVEKITEARNDSNPRENKTYYAYLDLYGEVANDTYTATNTSTYQGVYDITMDVENVVTSSVPMNIAIGYKNGELFYSTATLKFTKDSITLSYPDSGETLAKATVYAAAKKDAKLKVRVDTEQNKLSVWLDDQVVLKNYPYVSPFPAASGYDMFSTVRIGVDSNNNMGDYIAVKNVYLEKLVSEDIGALGSTLSAADSLTIDILTDTPDNVNADLKSLPAQIGDYAVEWSCTNSQIDTKTGEVFFDNTANDVVLTAYIHNSRIEYPAYVRKDFKLHIAAGNSAEYGEYLINSLGAITNQYYADIRYDLNIPANSDVTWTVSPEGQGIIGNDGKFVANAAVYKPTDITVTASAYGSTKDYKLTVSPRTEQRVLYSGVLPATISYGTYRDLKLSHAIVTEFNIENSDKTGKVDIVGETGNVIMSVIVEEGYFYFDYKGSDYAKHMFVSDAAKSVKIVTLSDVGKLAVWVDNKLVVDYADYKTDASYVAQVVTSNDAMRITNFKMTTDDYGMLQLNMDNHNYFAEVDKGVIGGDVTLSTTTLTGAIVTWNSGNTGLLANDGKVNVPNAITVTTLDFKLADANNSNVYISEQFDLVVVPAESGNFANGAAVSVTKHENLTYPKTNVNDNDYDSVYRITTASTSASDIVFDLHSENLVNAMLLVEEAGSIRNVTLSASTDNSTWTPVYTGDMANVVNGIVKFDITPARYIKLTINSADSTNVDVNEIKFYLSATAAEIAQIDLNNLSVPGTASSNLTLVTTGAYGSTITWTSSNPGVISSTGAVTRPAEGTTVTLTATIMADGTPYTRTFNVYVSSTSTNGPVVVPGGGSGGGGGGGAGGGGSASTDVTIGNDITKPVYTDPSISDEVSGDSDNYYSDVDEDDWYYEAVMKLTEKGIVSGDGTGGFNPNDKVTREQFLKMLLEAAGVEFDNAENTFEDVNTSAWYADYVLTAKKLNIVSGMSATEFGIGAQISRQDMAVFIERLINILNLTIEKQEVEDFADAADVSEYAITAVANMKAIGLIQGYNNNYNPKDSLTRAEAATVIASLLDILSEQ